MEHLCRERTEALLLAKGLRVDRAGQRRVQTAVAAAIQRASLVLKDLALGYASQPAGNRSNRPEADARTMPTAPPLPLQKLLDSWKAERRPVAKTVYEYTRVVRDLKEHLGHDDARRIASKDLVAWKASMVEAGLAPKTIRDAKLAPIRAILRWAADNELLSSNPAERVSIDVKIRAADSKRGFDDQEAKTILAAAGKDADPVRRWVPLLGAYSGARVSELCQLRVQDVQQIEGVWCMKLLPEAGSLKTRGSERVVPLHHAVIDAGFLKFVEKGKPGPLFPDLPPDKFGKQGGNGTKVIGRWVRGLGLTDPRLSPSHSWRHRFKTLGRRHGLMPDIVNAITGHHRKTVADSYGEFPVEALYREISKIPAVRL